MKNILQVFNNIYSQNILILINNGRRKFEATLTNKQRIRIIDGRKRN